MHFIMIGLSRSCRARIPRVTTHPRRTSRGATKLGFGRQGRRDSWYKEREAINGERVKAEEEVLGVDIENGC